MTWDNMMGVLGLISLLASLFFAYQNWSRADKAQSVKEGKTEQMLATVIETLNEMKAEAEEQRQIDRNHSEQLIRHDEKLQKHDDRLMNHEKRIERLEGLQ